MRRKIKIFSCIIWYRHETSNPAYLKNKQQIGAFEGK